MPLVPSRRARLALPALAAALAAGATTSAGPAGAAEVRLTVAGAALPGAVLPPGPQTVSVTGAPAGTSAVRFVLDGTYVGLDRSAPYTVTVDASPGPHVLKARVSVGDAVHRSEATFTTARGAVAPAPAPTASPTTTSPTAAPGTVRVRTATELTAALRAARPGTVITLADGRYAGRFVASAAGTAQAPVVLRGSRSAVLDAGTSGYALHLQGAHHWRLDGFTVRGGQKGVVLDGSRHVALTGLDVGRTGQEAVHFRSGSSDGVLADSLVHDTGLAAPGYGEGVYIGSAKSNWGTWSGGLPDRSDRVRVLRTRIWATTAESIDVKEGTTGGVISGNTFDGAGLSGANHADSWLDVKGNGYRVHGNTGTTTLRDGIQTHVAVAGWGKGNTFSGNVLRVDGPGRGFSISSPSITGNVVGCSNVVVGAAGGFANVRCS